VGDAAGGAHLLDGEALLQALQAVPERLAAAEEDRHERDVHADLTGANLIGANLTKANLTGAVLDGANLTRADLTGARRSDQDPVLDGWMRDPGTGTLKRVGLPAAEADT
jgi:hypothetical protein